MLELPSLLFHANMTIPVIKAEQGIMVMNQIILSISVVILEFAYGEMPPSEMNSLLTHSLLAGLSARLPHDK